jgi:protein-S-isoprenylcysteine O-methyltransferase Ste14
LTGENVKSNNTTTTETRACPPSATHGAVAAAGLAAFLFAVLVIRIDRPFGDNVVNSALFVIGMTAAAIFLLDLGWQKVHLRPSTGIDFGHDDPSWNRSLFKYLGLLGSLGFVGFLYWLLPEYHAKFYERYYEMLRSILPAWIALALPYLYLVDRRMRNPRDGYWHMGKLVSLQWDDLDRNIIGQHLLGWLIKGFFLPLMFTYLCNDIDRFVAVDFAQMAGFKPWFDFLYDSFYLIDVGLVSMGYLMSLRIADTHLRSAEPTMLGWAVALACYEPFWSLIGRQYLAYETELKWGTWLWNTPILYGLWGTGILVLTAIYVWATVIFGARFSNLTHRGIITNGPYRWTKHPAYVAKNLSWWMISIPFIAQGTPDEALRHCFLLLTLNGIYALRARTEEWHLSRDPDYVAYALWIEQHGILRFVRYLPLVRHLAYRAPVSARAGAVL